MVQASRGKPAMRAQWRMMAVSAVGVALLVPAAIAWACNPQASVRTDKPTYNPGATMHVSGSFFQGNRSITLSVEPGGASSTVTTSGNGFFATQIPAPSGAGSYTISAIGFEADGTVTTGLPARVSFQVTQSSPATQPGTTTPGTQESPGITPGSGASQPGAGKFAEPSVPDAGRITSGARIRRARARGERSGARQTAAVNAGAGVIDSPAGNVFAGSVARADRVGASAARERVATGRNTKSAAKVAIPSEGSAASDAWSGLNASNLPGLLPSASDGAPNGGGTSSGFAVGLGLMGVALLALVGGLAVAARTRLADSR